MIVHAPAGERRGNERGEKGGEGSERKDELDAGRGARLDHRTRPLPRGGGAHGRAAPVARRRLGLRRASRPGTRRPRLPRGDRSGAERPRRADAASARDRNPRRLRRPRPRRGRRPVRPRTDGGGRASRRDALHLRLRGLLSRLRLPRWARRPTRRTSPPRKPPCPGAGGLRGDRGSAERRLPARTRGRMVASRTHRGAPRGRRRGGSSRSGRATASASGRIG